MLTVKEVAQRLNLSQGIVYKAVNDGQLEHHRFGATIRITEEQLSEYLEKTRAGVLPSPRNVKSFSHLDL